jgi:hypothetical protein
MFNVIDAQKMPRYKEEEETEPEAYSLRSLRIQFPPLTPKREAGFAWFKRGAWGASEDVPKGHRTGHHRESMGVL